MYWMPVAIKLQATQSKPLPVHHPDFVAPRGLASPSGEQLHFIPEAAVLLLPGKVSSAPKIAPFHFKIRFSKHSTS